MPKDPKRRALRASDRIDMVAQMALEEAYREFKELGHIPAAEVSDLIAWATVIFQAYIHEGIRHNGKRGAADD